MNANFDRCCRRSRAEGARCPPTARSGSMSDVPERRMAANTLSASMFCAFVGVRGASPMVPAVGSSVWGHRAITRSISSAVIPSARPTAAKETAQLPGDWLARPAMRPRWAPVPRVGVERPAQRPARHALNPPTPGPPVCHVRAPERSANRQRARARMRVGYNAPSNLVLDNIAGLNHSEM
jgi:hypothetical protein